MSDDQNSLDYRKFNDENIMNVPKICLLPQPATNSPENVYSRNNPPSYGNYKFSHRDSGTFDSLSMGSKANINAQINTIHNWFKHLPGSDQAHLMSTLFPSVHFDYMAMIAGIAIKQKNFISNEVSDYQKFEDEANNLESLSRLTDEPSILAVNLLSRLPLLCPSLESDNSKMVSLSKTTTSSSVHKLYANLLTQVFSQEFSDIEELLAVKQLATLISYHPNLNPHLQSKLIELAIERNLLEDHEECKRRPRRPGALSPIGTTCNIMQGHSFSLLVPSFMGSGCISASASPLSVCSYNSSGFLSGPESSGRRTQAPLSPPSSACSCAGDDHLLSNSYDHDNMGFIQNVDKISRDCQCVSAQDQFSIDTPTPNNVSSFLMVGKHVGTHSCSFPFESLKSASPLTLNISDSNSILTKDEEVDSEASFSMYRENVDNERNTFLEKDSGMSYIPCWLKSLRLHKYAGLFQQLTYEEMLSITDEWLESKNVTKGARNKILLNIQKLETRQSTLLQVETELISTGTLSALRACINEIKHILMTPIKPFRNNHFSCPVNSLTEADSPPNSINGNVLQGDLPNQIVRCLSKVCSQLLVSKKIEEESYVIFLQILDNVIEHESFTMRHKNLCRSWRGQLEGTRGLPRKLNSWIDSQRTGFRKGNKQASLQACSFPNVSSQIIQSSTPACPLMESNCPILSSVPFSSISNITSSISWKYGSQSFIIPQQTLTSQQQYHPVDESSKFFIKRQVERKLSAPNGSALMDLFLQCQSNLSQHVDQGFEKQLVTMSQILPISSTSTSFCVIPSWSLGSEIGSIDALVDEQQSGADNSSNGSQDPITAEINWNLDLLAREVTEKAIKDPESPDK